MPKPIDTESPEHMEAVAKALESIGFDASSHHTGGNIYVLRLIAGNSTWDFGTADTTWGAILIDEDGYTTETAIQTTCDSAENDPAKVAASIAATLNALSPKDGAKLDALPKPEDSAELCPTCDGRMVTFSGEDCPTCYGKGR